MAKTTRNFTLGRMNKVLDQRVLPQGEYVDALNIRLGNELSDIGVISNTKGNTLLTDIKYIDGTGLSSEARTIGKFADSTNETIYWFVHDPAFTVGATGKLDLIVSYNTISEITSYHIISIDDGDGENTTLNFDPQYLITGVNKVDNLIFWVQGNNPPRFFNIKRNYPIPVANVDAFTAKSILVIKQPPIEAPTISLFTAQGQQNFIDTRFICFAYRYKYADNEYSAISQFTEPAFIPQQFNFSIDSFLNEGMVNANNSVEISFNTGDELVVGIDLLFKEADNNTIKVIEKIIKADKPYANNVIEKYIYNNSKIFTILPEYEILRLYDNVPRFALAQTVLSNRLFYGNYIEGYNMFDENAQAVQLVYEADLVTEIIGDSDLTTATETGNYNINGSTNVADSVLEIDLGSLTFPLLAGGALNIDVTLTHSQFTGSPEPSETSTNIELPFTFYLTKDYTSAYALAISQEFQEAIGVVGGANGIQTTPSTYCDGSKYTDYFNCALPSSLDSLDKVESGVDAAPQPILISAGFPTTASTIIGLQFPAMKYSDGTTTVYEYYTITFASVSYQEIANPTSLHSNRSYEVAIIYQDDFLRSTTALVSTNNTVFVPCGNSGLQNKIQVTIPINQKPPSWATRYKLAIKADGENYETIYSSIFFNDPSSNASYLLVEGENAQKVETGDRLIVKRDTAGVVTNCAYATILEKDTKESGFLTIPSAYNPAVNIPVPSGVYLKINPNSFTVEYDERSYIAYGTLNDTANGGDCPTVNYPVSIEDPDNVGDWIDYTIPAGSRINLFFKFERLGKGDGNSAPCDKRINIIEKTLISSANYNNFKDWFDGDNVSAVLNQGTYEIRSGTCIPNNVYNPTLGTSPNISCDGCDNYYQFIRDSSNNQLYLSVNGTESCTNKLIKGNQSRLWIKIEVFRAETVMVFETEPSPTLPDVFYENNLSFAITNGFHEGNIQNQTASLPAIIDTEFFNCYAFGNGVESYKIRDSVSGKSFNFGNRVTAVAAQDYKEANRFADITYSGVYNDESNINKFNEFNLGLVNYKPLEDAFGAIHILDARETDILVLQEDKISYVLAGKNLLSDAGAGSALTSVPEVLGQQIARVEKYGISSNPESYVHWGYDRYFTDVKRGAVLQLKGGSYNSDQLIVVSDFGMTTYFRDLFIEAATTQKLGAYDPYMKEYVLSSNDIEIPSSTECVSCGMRQIFIVEPYNDVEYCVDAGTGVGETVIEWTVLPLGVNFEVIATYNGTETSSGVVNSNGSIVVNKNAQNIQEISILIMSTYSITLTMTVKCPLSEQMTIVLVTVTNDEDAGGFVHNNYNYINGTFISPVTSNLITFQSGTQNPLVSQYTSLVGEMGGAFIPNSGATVTMICSKINFDTFDFDAAKNKFKYLVSDTLYENNASDITALLAAANTATPNQGSGTNQYAQFTMSGSLDYLYLIWDYRAAEAVELCYSTDLTEACCDCEDCLSECSEYFISNASSNTIIAYKDCYTGVIDTMEVEPNQGYFLCSRTDYPPIVDLGSADIATVNACGCNGCADTYGGCATFRMVVYMAASVSYTPCGGTPIIAPFNEGTYEITTSGEVPVILAGSVTLTFLNCGE